MLQAHQYKEETEPKEDVADSNEDSVQKIKANYKPGQTASESTTASEEPATA